MGGIEFRKLSDLVKDIWMWSDERNIWLVASYISSKDNVTADFESWCLEPETEYELSNKAFVDIRVKLGNPEIDLFATRVNIKCQKYVSWLKHPESFAVDAFTNDWRPHLFYAFPPFAIILTVLQKIRSEGSTGIVVVPHWPAQPWFPLYQSMIESDPIYFNPNINLLRSSNREVHPMWRRITLIAARLSGKRSELRTFHKNQSK